MTFLLLQDPYDSGINRILQICSRIFGAIYILANQSTIVPQTHQKLHGVWREEFLQQLIYVQSLALANGLTYEPAKELTFESLYPAKKFKYEGHVGHPTNLVLAYDSISYDLGSSHTAKANYGTGSILKNNNGRIRSIPYFGFQQYPHQTQLDNVSNPGFCLLGVSGMSRMKEGGCVPGCGLRVTYRAWFGFDVHLITVNTQTSMIPGRRNYHFTISAFGQTL